MRRTTRSSLLLLLTVLLALALLPTQQALAQDETPPPADIVNDEGGPVSITGEVTYTAPFFTLGVAEPVIILEDQAGFVDRNERYLMPLASQTLGQLTSDFYTSPFSYSIALPIEPQGSFRDVDNDEEEEPGVQIFAIAYWNNTFGDPFLEERDLGGGGWSTAYASTHISEEADTEREIIGGDFLVYAPDDSQGFPARFGEDGLLFTGDEPIVTLPAGYTIVNMDTDPFTFDRSRAPVIDLIEPEGTALVDLSEKGYAEAFNEFVDILMKEYAFTEYKGIDWEALRAEFLPRFAEADADSDSLAYLRALRDFAWSIPDGHVSGPFVAQDFQEAVATGLGMAIRETDDGRVIVNFVTPDDPAEAAGIALGTEIVALDGVPILTAIDNAVAYSAPFGTEHFKQLQQMRYVVRFPEGSQVEVTWLDEEGAEVSQVLEPINETASFNFSSFNIGRTGFELPVEYRLLEESSYGYVKLNSFSDNSLLTVQLWERLMRNLNQNGVEGLIIDMRQNGGGSGFLADQMAAYFFNESFVLGTTGKYDKSRDEFYFDPRYEDIFYLPTEDLRYNGEIAVVIGPNCNSACEFFSYDMTIDGRATIVGQYPTAGLGGSVAQILLPENEFFQYTKGRAVDNNGEIHIEGKGVPPDVVVPVNEETLLTDADVLLEAAIIHLDDALAIEVEDGGAIAVGESVDGEILDNVRVRYTLELTEGDIINLTVTSDAFDPIVTLYATDGTELLANDDLDETTLNAGFVDLEIPVDLILLVEVASVDGVGAYTLSVEDAAAAGAEGESGDAGADGEGSNAGTADAGDAPAEGTSSQGIVVLDIMATAEAAGSFSVLIDFLQATGLDETLMGKGPFTVFAPTDEAFAAIPEGVITALADEPDVLGQILLYHVAAGALTAVDLVEMNEVEMLNGDIIAVSVEGGIVYIETAAVTEADIETSNGMIHIVDSVLLPPDVELP